MPEFDARTLGAAVRAHFDAHTLAKGRVYQLQRRVRNCRTTQSESAGWLLAGDVRGTQPTPYDVEIELSTGSDGTPVIQGSCSCPMIEDCKHVAAVLLHALEKPEQWFNPRTAPASDAAPSMVNSPFVGSRLDRPWEQWLRELEQSLPAVPGPSDAPALRGQPPELPEEIRYILRPQPGKLKLDLAVVRRLKTGGYGQPHNLYLGNVLYNRSPAPFVRPVDVLLARKAMLAQANFNTFELFLQGAAGAELLKEILATGRCHWRGSGKQHPVLSLGPARAAQPAWIAAGQGRQQPSFHVTPPATSLLPLAPPWYLDEAGAICGPLETGLADAVACAWLTAPLVVPDQATAVSAELIKRAGTLGLPAPLKVEVEEVSDVTPVPCLRLYSARLKQRLHRYGWVADEREVDEEFSFALLEFDYAGSRVAAQESGDALEHFADGRLRRVRRRPRLESNAERALSDAGFENARHLLFDFDIRKLGRELTLADPEDWFDFVHSTLPGLRDQGWRIDIDESFGIRLAVPEDWYGDAQAEGGNDWFGIELGVLLDGQKVNLLPILIKVLQTSPHTLNSDTLTQLSDDAIIPVPLPDGRTLPFPASRARQMLGVLLELLDPNSLDRRGRLRLNKLRAAELAGEADWRWLGNAELTELSRRLRSFDGIKPVKPPPDLSATLRPYQQEGLNWLQFLREYELAGILADDMGLGKTVQALAHLLAEKESGRADRPSLVVAPTSLMTNWRQETERFAPALRVLVLHGLARKSQFERIPEHDLVITSYPLLPRDQAVLLQHKFHFVILDEAQFIKNPKTTYAQVACQLKARHHLCLTGTPMENHLGELWSLFHFLLPGFLGDEIRFNSIFRRPIEKGKNDERRKLLARRVAPFVLRRRKEEVMKELPPKTEIVQNVELTGAQRDLYESVRLAMHERVKTEVDRKGLSRAHIIILDALLKLRQICCHPQLLALPSAQKVKESAKFELLMDLLPEMIEEGRRILLFSQFTSMLAIIESALKAKTIPYVRLAGDTVDRATPVARFQGGEVPLFLISLKAGGTGLNLTAADTVIHYDPWWNPAVENQATDRAHRIGQDKSVFVYKLMTVGTVEEKIVAMQTRKRELVEGLLNEERRESLKLTAEDLDVLFAPLQ